ncbi:13056_t:CDS:2, partial [Funneliformis mosseae]
MDKRKEKNKIIIGSNSDFTDKSTNIFKESNVLSNVKGKSKNKHEQHEFEDENSIKDDDVSVVENSKSENLSNIHNESSIFSVSFKNIKSMKYLAKDFNRMESEEITVDNGNTVKIIFHVHLPNVHVGVPVIVGNIEELGNWREPKVKLEQYKKGWNYSSDSSYWYSEPIVIPIKRFHKTVKYNYAVFSSHLQFEGYDPLDVRVLEIQRQKFDIWNNNYFHRIDRITDYMFLDIIYESATLESIKHDILYYDSILRQHREFTLSVTNIQFISKRISVDSIGKQLFLCFLLGHCPNINGRNELPNDFQSVTLLQAFFTIDSDTFPKDSLYIVLKGLDILIHHNIHNGLLAWLEIFTVAQNFDPQYEFIDTITFSKCDDEKYIENCFELVLKLEFDESSHVKIIKWLMSQCKNVKILSIVWQSSNNKNDKKLRQLLIENIKKIISNDDPDNLHRNFTMLPDDIRDIVSDLFRKRVLDILINGRRVIWDCSKYQSIFVFLNSVHLRWTKDEYIVVLELVSILDDYQLLSMFPSLLENLMEMSKGIENKIAQIYTQWYKNLMDRMDQISSNSTDHKGEYIIAVLEKLSSICSLINEQSKLDELMEITFDRIKCSSELSILNTAPNVEQFGSAAVRVFTKVIEEKIDSMKLDRVKPLLNKMQVICGSTGKSLKIPNNEQYEIKEETCQTLVSFVNRNAILPQMKDHLFNYFNCEKDKYERALETINHRLGRIFETLQKHERPVKNSEGRVMSDI